jgi:hypothetical protein
MDMTALNAGSLVDRRCRKHSIDVAVRMRKPGFREVPAAGRKASREAAVLFRSDDGGENWEPNLASSSIPHANSGRRRTPYRGLIDRSLLGTRVLHRGVRQPDARCARLDSSLRVPCHGR